MRVVLVALPFDELQRLIREHPLQTAVPNHVRPESTMHFPSRLKSVHQDTYFCEGSVPARRVEQCCKTVGICTAPLCEKMNFLFQEASRLLLALLGSPLLEGFEVALL